MSPHGEAALTDPDGGGRVLRWLPDAERQSFAEEVRRCYWLPGADSGHPIQYTGHEFTDEAGKRLIYLERHC